MNNLFNMYCRYKYKKRNYKIY